jgi:uncharacterized protein
MICPRCNKPTLEERERDGITMDVCMECRGIWLDRGELERLIARANQESIDAYDRQPRHEYSHEQEHDNHDHHKHHGHGDSSHHRRRHWLAELFD